MMGESYRLELLCCLYILKINRNRLVLYKFKTDKIMREIFSSKGFEVTSPRYSDRAVTGV